MSQTVLSQKDAVDAAIAACKDESGNFDRKAVIDKLSEMYDQGLFLIKSESKKASEKSRREYFGSVLTNWLRKDARHGAVTASVPVGKKQKNRPADDEMKRLMMAKVLLVKDNLPTEEIDERIALRTSEIERLKHQANADLYRHVQNLLS